MMSYIDILISYCQHKYLSVIIIIIIIIIIASQHSDMVSDEQKLVLSENEVVPY